MYRAQVKEWSMERVIRLMAGVFTLTGLTLSLTVHPYWLALPGLVGFNLVLFSFTGLCPMAMLLHRFGIEPECRS